MSPELLLVLNALSFAVGWLLGCYKAFLRHKQRRR